MKISMTFWTRFMSSVASTGSGFGPRETIFAPFCIYAPVAKDHRRKTEGGIFMAKYPHRIRMPIYREEEVNMSKVDAAFV